jgi:S1-C subfamily serine protease
MILSELSNGLAELVAQVLPSTGIVTGRARDFSASAGSAWMFDAELLVTNHHVVADLQPPIHVRLPHHPVLPATLVGTDPVTDLAVLRIASDVAPPLLTRATEPRLGELCLTFGSPLGEYPESVSLGVVSGVHRSTAGPGGRPIEDMIQTDAAINAGNSGGPLIGVDGRLIGVNDCIRSDAQNIGFAIPAASVADTVPEIVEHGTVVRASLGISVATKLVERGGRQVELLAVTSVRATHNGDLRQGDVLLALNGSDIQRRADLLRLLRRDLVGTAVEAQILRDGKVARSRVVPSAMKPPP